MEITDKVREDLLNLGEHEAYVAARAAELSVDMYDNDLFLRCHSLTKNLHARINVGVGQIPTSFNMNSPWQSSVVSEAFKMRDIEMLSFIDRLMVPTRHNPDLLRTVFTHAYNFGIDPDSITSEHVEAYRLLTGSGYREFNTQIISVSPANSEALIRRVLFSTKDALAAAQYIRTISFQFLEPLFAYMDSARDIEPALLAGTL